MIVPGQCRLQGAFWPLPLRLCNPNCKVDSDFSNMHFGLVFQLRVTQNAFMHRKARHLVPRVVDNFPLICYGYAMGWK